LDNENKKRLIADIEQLLNTYGSSSTSINPTLLDYMSEDDLKKIIDDLLRQKESLIDENEQWLQQFKKEKKD